MFDLTKFMFKSIWDQRLTQADEVIKSTKQQVRIIEKQTEALLERIVGATNHSVIEADEKKVAMLEHDKRLITEKVANHKKPQGTMEEKLEPALQFLASPWKIWEPGQITLQRAVLRLAFKDRLAYHLKKGTRTAQLPYPSRL